MKDKNYSFEERDDERTWWDIDGNNQITPDSEKEERYPSDEELNAATFEAFYVAEFLNLISCCGKVSYFYNMKLLMKDKNEKVEDVADKYHHDVKYYDDRYAEWAKKSRKSFALLKSYASNLNYEMLGYETNFLNSLALCEGRRKCYRYYLRKYPKYIFSPKELEEKYLNRIKKSKK